MSKPTQDAKTTYEDVNLGTSDLQSRVVILPTGSKIGDAVREAEAATIERCAQVAKSFGYGGYEQIADAIAAAILGLKDKPSIDPNLVYPGKDPDFVFPDET